MGPGGPVVGSRAVDHGKERRGADLDHRGIGKSPGDLFQRPVLEFLLPGARIVLIGIDIVGSVRRV
jgi:hypothetical protein